MSNGSQQVSRQPVYSGVDLEEVLVIADMAGADDVGNYPGSGLEGLG